MANNSVEMSKLEERLDQMDLQQLVARKMNLMVQLHQLNQSQPSNISDIPLKPENWQNDPSSPEYIKRMNLIAQGIAEEIVLMDLIDMMWIKEATSEEQKRETMIKEEIFAAKLAQEELLRAEIMKISEKTPQKTENERDKDYLKEVETMVHKQINQLNQQENKIQQKINALNQQVIQRTEEVNHDWQERRNTANKQVIQAVEDYQEKHLDFKVYTVVNNEVKEIPRDQVEDKLKELFPAEDKSTTLFEKLKMNPVFEKKLVDLQEEVESVVDPAKQKIIEEASTIVANAVAKAENTIDEFKTLLKMNGDGENLKPSAIKDLMTKNKGLNQIISEIQDKRVEKNAEDIASFLGLKGKLQNEHENLAFTQGLIKDSKDLLNNIKDQINNLEHSPRPR